MMDGVIFELPPRYTPIGAVGSGTYGTVISATDNQKNCKVAIKKLRRIEDLVDAKRILREIRIMRLLIHENILNLDDIVYVPIEGDTENLGDIYLVTIILETDLHKVLKSNLPLSDDHIQYFVYQMLRACLFIHSANVIHRDMKPSNVLLNENCDIKICDFGLSRKLSMDKGENLTEYVVTRFYRAPEIMLSSHHYHKAVDIWSVGCTVAEILTKKVLFPGDNYIEQINLIIELCGTPDEETMELITNEYAKKYLQGLPKCKRVPLSNIIKYENSKCIDLIEKMLEFNPHRRITIEDALKHPYLEALHDPEDEPLFKGEIDFAFEDDPNLKLADVNGLIMDEIKIYDKK